MFCGNLTIKSEIIKVTCSICRITGSVLAEEWQREEAVHMLNAFGPPNVSQVTFVKKCFVSHFLPAFNFSLTEISLEKL